MHHRTLFGVPLAGNALHVVEAFFLFGNISQTNPFAYTPNPKPKP
jgi:hypothetical protein